MSPVRLPLRLVVGFWAIPVLLSATQHVALAPQGAAGPGWAEALMRPAPGWFTWALFSLLVLQLGQRVPPARAGWARALAVHLPVALAMALIHIAVLVAANRIRSPLAAQWTWAEQYASFLSGMLHVDLLIYGAILTVGHGLAEHRASREREMVATQLREQLTAARLHALRMQLNPHFLFNSLNTAVTLVRTGENRTAARMLTGLGDLLRQTLDENTVQEVPLRQELELVRRYADVERLRFQERLRVEFDIAPDLLEARVPGMILQPLVENAIRHGIESRPDGGVVMVRGRRAGDTIELEVRDDGTAAHAAEHDETAAGQAEDRLARSGIGLANTRERIARLYPGGGRVELVSTLEGTTARVVIPCPAAPCPAAPCAAPAAAVN